MPTIKRENNFIGDKLIWTKNKKPENLELQRLPVSTALSPVIRVVHCQ
jgi:hypothetical protein